MQASETQEHGPWQRCFIALAPDVATRDALAALDVPSSARRVPYEQLHLTVTFIGALTAERGERLAAELAQPGAALEPAPITGIEHWPNATHPRLTVARLAMTDGLLKLDWRVRSLMIDLGLPVDARSFRPHITLARFGRDAAAPEPCAQPPANLQANFEALVLYSSTLARHGARYRALASAAVG
ncbi:RNA 2',3'-cyclic phosphodiesterase [Paraburkholderia sp. DHOC27]|uniref:RNA 2',3'-cyclic phosphodiesterase n=1 Tax=Paraburkholderia sp. DHOC27 TaxID=2303330 RepID=UPI000E3C1B61|nr:RNA 2',3'-cyclic phosphodiesterase [Paraburkholderia sp. DHOC27]RFU43920.1 RNA 2',3'-cyclic phosphodiesterase [Paraburkholderia sp. DHOC27]